MKSPNPHTFLLNTRNFSGSPLIPGILLKQIAVLLITLCCFVGLRAQSTGATTVPQKFDYTTQVTDSLGLPVSNTFINMRATLHSGSATGTVVYCETDTGTSSPSGIFTVVVGGGTIVSGNFSTVPWTTGTIYFQVEMDVTGGTNFINMGNAQLISQPYSLVSGNGIGAVSFDTLGRATFNTANGLSVYNSAKGAWMTTGNAGMGAINAYMGTTDATDLVLKRNNVEGLRVGANKVSVAGNLGVGGVTAPLTAADVNGAIALRDTVITVTSSFTLNVGNRSLFLINASNPFQHSLCTLGNGLVPGQLLMIMVSKTGGGNNSGVNFSPGANLRLLNNNWASLTDGSTISFVWNGTAWLETSVSVN